jgi:hypothetical protein
VQQTCPFEQPIWYSLTLIGHRRLSLIRPINAKSVAIMGNDGSLLAGICPDGTYNWVMRDISRRRRTPQQMELDRQAVIRLHKENWSIRGITSELGIPKSSVESTLKTYKTALARQAALAEDGEHERVTDMMLDRLEGAWHFKDPDLLCGTDAGPICPGPHVRTVADVRKLDALQLYRTRRLSDDHPAKIMLTEAMSAPGWTMP